MYTYLAHLPLVQAAVYLCSADLARPPLALTPPQQRALRGPARSRQPNLPANPYLHVLQNVGVETCSSGTRLHRDHHQHGRWHARCNAIPLCFVCRVEFPVMTLTAQCLSIAFHTPELQAETSCVRSSCAAATCSSRRKINPMYHQPISQLLGLVFRCRGVRRRGCRCRPSHCPFFIALSILSNTILYMSPLKASSPPVFLQEQVSGVQLQRIANMAATGQLCVFFSALMSRQLPVFRCHAHGPVVLHAGDLLP